MDWRYCSLALNHQNMQQEAVNLQIVEQDFIKCTEVLTHWGLSKMVDILHWQHFKCILLNENFIFWFKFHWRLSLGVHLTTSEHWFRQWLCAKPVTSYYLNKWWQVHWHSVRCSRPQWVNTLRPRQHGPHFPDDIFKYILLNENVWITIKSSLKFVPKGPINNIPALVQIMAWHRPVDKPSSEPMLVSLPTHICVTRPQWVKLYMYYLHSYHFRTTLRWLSARLR